MFRITEDPSSESIVQCLAKNYKNYSIVSVDMDKVGVVTVYSDILKRHKINKKKKKSVSVLMCTLTLHLKVLQTVIVFWEGSILSRRFVAFGFENSFLCWKMAETPDSCNLVVEKCNKTIRTFFSQ